MWIRSRDARAASLLATILVAGCGAEEIAEEPPLRPVRIMEVHSAGSSRTRILTGVAQADVESTLSFRVAGNIQRLLVQPGDRVEAQQLIAELDPTDYELRLQEAEAALIQAEAQARQADADYDRARGLYENRNTSKSELDASRARSESMRAQIDAALQRVEQARAQLSYTRLRAPATGSIGRVPVEVNENVSSGEDVAVLTSGERPQVDVRVPESLIGEIERGGDVVVRFDALPGRAFDAGVTEVGIMASTLSTTFPVMVQLREAETDVRAGMAAQVEFRFPVKDDRERFIVPAQAVSEDREGRFVFVVEPSGDGVGLVRRRAVTIGELTGEGLEVLDGLADGENVVTAGVSQIRDGLEVKTAS